MSQNTSISLVNLDVATLKSEFIDFLKTQDRFKDMNFAGSNINTLLDVLSINSYQNAFYLNMVASEMFLDSAQLRSSILSHAKELNYLPRSCSSAKATVQINLTAAGFTDYTLPKKTAFTAAVGDSSYTFSTDSAVILDQIAEGVFSGEVDIYEGLYLTESFIFNETGYQQFPLSSLTIDTNSITVKVVEDGGEVVRDYKYAKSLFGLEKGANVFFVTTSVNGKYVVTFGEGDIVNKPKVGSVVVVEYRSCFGQLPNGADSFSLVTTLPGTPAVTVTTVSAAAGGDVAESDAEIKFNAPRYFQTQERAVTSSDYEVLLKQNFAEIRAINAYGGEENDPPQYGKVVISVDLRDVEGITEAKRNEYYSWIKARMPLSIDPVFINPEFIYVVVNSTVTYNSLATDLTTKDIQSLVQNQILNYSDESLNDFGKVLRYSRFVDMIDAADSSIVSNDTSLKVYKSVQPLINTPMSFTINFYNALKNIESSRFVFRETTCYIKDNAGILSLYAVNSSTPMISNVGSVDYNSGRVQINNLTVESFQGSGLTFTAETVLKDVFAEKNNLVVIRGSDIKVLVRAES